MLLGKKEHINPSHHLNYNFSVVSDRNNIDINPAGVFRNTRNIIFFED